MLCDKVTVFFFQNMTTVNVVTFQDRAVKFSAKMQDYPVMLKQSQSSVIMCHLPTFMFGDLRHFWDPQP